MRRTQAANISLLRRRTAKVRAYCRSFGTLVGKQGMSSLSREQHRDAARTHGLSRAFRGPSSERSLVAEPRPQQRWRCMAGPRRGRGCKAGRCWELPIADEVSNPKGATGKMKSERSDCHNGPMGTTTKRDYERRKLRRQLRRTTL